MAGRGKGWRIQGRALMGVYRILIDWNGNGTLGDANEDITADVMNMESFRGRDSASQLSGRSRAGSLILTLENSAGKYNSFNSASAIYGNILPGRKVQVQTFDSFPYTFPIVFAGTPVWTGYLDRIEISPSPHHAHRATLYASGVLARVAGKKAHVAMQTSRRTDQAIGDVLDDVGIAAGDRDLETGQTTMNRWWCDNQDGLNALRDIEGTEWGFLWEKADGDIAFADRHFRFTETRCITAQATFSDANGALIAYSSIDQGDPLREIFNIVEAKVQRHTVGSLATLWTLSESGTNSPVIDAGATRIWWASYPNPDSVTNAVAVDAWTTPVENTDYEANTQAGGGGTDKSSVLTVTVTKFAQAMKIQIQNTDTVAVYLTLLQARGTPVTADDPVTVTAEDSTSQTAYGERTYPIPGPFIPDTDEAENYVGAVVSAYKDPIPTLRVAISANRNQTAYANAIVREINDRVTVVATNDSDLGINEDFFIEAIRHRIDQHRHHWVIFDLSSVRGFSGFWVLGVSRLGLETRVAY